MSKIETPRPIPQKIRGTQDIFGAEAEAFAHVVETFERVRKLYRFRRVEMPVFEKTEVFSRSLGETTDVVSKEMYSFEDRGGESLTLRPEFTAGIARAYLTDGWQQYAPLKVATHGPLFRYERPQKGRYRQFHQLDAEIIGAAEPQADVELLAMADQLLKELGIPSTVVVLRTQMKGDFHSSLPSFAPFDHAIAYVPSLDLYLDGTAEHTGVDELPAMDVGAIGLLVNEGNAKLVRLPQTRPDKNFLEQEVLARLEAGGQARLELSYKTSGFNAADWRSRYHADATRRERGPEAAPLPGGSLSVALAPSLFPNPDGGVALAVPFELGEKLPAGTKVQWSLLAIDERGRQAAGQKGTTVATTGAGTGLARLSLEGGRYQIRLHATSGGQQGLAIADIVVPGRAAASGVFSDNVRGTPLRTGLQPPPWPARHRPRPDQRLSG